MTSSSSAVSFRPCPRAESVVGYSTLTDSCRRNRRPWLSSWVSRGRWFSGHRHSRYLIIPSFGWRPMFIIAGVGHGSSVSAQEFYRNRRAGWNRKAAPKNQR